MHCDQYDVLLSSRPNELQGFGCICFLQKILLIETVFTLVWTELSDGFYVVLINQCLQPFFRHTHCQKSTLSDVKSLFHVSLENSEKVFIKCSRDNARGQVTWSDGMQCADAVLLSCCIAVLAMCFWLLLPTQLFDTNLVFCVRTVFGGLSGISTWNCAHRWLSRKSYFEKIFKFDAVGCCFCVSLMACCVINVDIYALRSSWTLSCLD